MSTPAAALPLRDIHLPPPPGWWPPAPGWWIVAALSLVLLALMLRWLLRELGERRWRRRIHAELERIAASHAAQPDAVHLAGEVSQLLRRATRLIDPAAVALRGDAWLLFLDRQLPPAQRDAAPFRSGAGRALADGPYRRTGDPALHAMDVRALLDLARSWLRHALPRRHGRV